MSAAPEAAERQKIVDELRALFDQQLREKEALSDRFAEARKPIQARCGALGHVFAPSRILPKLSACLICDAVKPE